MLKEGRRSLQTAPVQGEPGEEGGLFRGVGECPGLRAILQAEPAGEPSLGNFTEPPSSTLLLHCSDEHGVSLSSGDEAVQVQPSQLLIQSLQSAAATVCPVCFCSACFGGGRGVWDSEAALGAYGANE